MTRLTMFATAMACAAIIACSSSSPTTHDAPATHDSPGSGSGTPLMVLNFDSWCSVAVGSAAASSSASQTVNVTPGTITLKATALSGFILGDWHHTNGDSGAGDPGTVAGGMSTAMVTVGSAATCVWVCCPFTGGTGCPSTDQCSGGG